MKRIFVIGMITLFAWGCSDDTEPNTQKDGSVADKGTVTPDNGTVTPDKGTVTPDKGTVIPDNGTVTPDKGTMTPDNGTVTPDKGTMTPDGSSSAGFGATVWPIFKAAGCTGSYCHGGTAGGLSMSSESVAYSNLVGTKATGCSTLDRVKASDVAGSYLIQKLEGKGSCFTGGKMPVGGTLTAAQLSTVKAWVTAGAAK